MDAPLTKSQNLNAFVPDTLKSLSGWLVWKKVPKLNNPGKFAKVPHYLNGTKRHGELGSEQDRAFLATFEHAIITLESGGYDGIGLAMLPEFGIVGGDFDDCIDDNGVIAPHVLEHVQGTYAEKSPSDKGIRAFWRGNVPDAKNHEAGIELFCGKGFLTVTGNEILDNFQMDVAPLPPTTRTRLLELVGHGQGVPGGEKSLNEPASTFPAAPSDIARIESALATVQSDYYDTWLHVGMGLKQELGEDGFPHWDKWSQSSGKYEQKACLDTWKSFDVKFGGIGIGTLFKLAQDNGWQDPRKQVKADAAVSKHLAVDYWTHSHNGIEPKPPEMLIEALLPASAVTLLAGHGGTGKSALALRMAVHLATGTPFAGHAVKRYKVIFYSSEDDSAILEWRLFKICRLMGIKMGDLKNDLRLLDVVGDNPVLYEETRGDGATTAQYAWLLGQVQEFGADVLIIDGASDTYDANEISRARVREFIRNLNQMTLTRKGAVILIAHVDKTTARGLPGTENNEGYSGSTAWNNSVRSRLLLSQDKDGLTLKHQKSNYGKKAEPIRLDWIDGIPTPFERASETSDTEKQSALAVKQQKILTLIGEFYNRGEFIMTANNSPANAWKMLKGEPGFPNGLAKDELAPLLRELERGGDIERETFKTPDRKQKERWKVRSCQGGESDVETLFSNSP